MEQIGSVDEIWRKFKTICHALEVATTEKAIKQAIVNVEEFVLSEVHRYYLHRWRGWSRLFMTLLNTSKIEIGKDIGISCIPTYPTHVLPKKTTKKTSVTSNVNAGRTTKRLTPFILMQREFVNAHLHYPPKLHLDPNGRNFIHQCVGFALALLERDIVVGEDKRINAIAWQCIEMVLKYRVYTVCLDETSLISILELGLAAVDPQNAAVIGGNMEVYVRCIQYVIQNSPYDLTLKLDKIIWAICNWFEKIPNNNSSMYASLAPEMLDALTSLATHYEDVIGPMMIQPSIVILKYIRSVWNYARIERKTVYTKFTLQFLRCVNLSGGIHSACKKSKFWTDGTQSGVSEADSNNLVKYRFNIIIKELKSYMELFTTTLEFGQQRGIGKRSVGNNTSSFLNPLSELEDTTLLHLICSAEVIYTHDTALLCPSELEIDLTIEDQIGNTNTLRPGRKRGREEITCSVLGWEYIIQCVCDSNTLSSINSVSSPFSSNSSRDPKFTKLQSQWSKKRDISPWLWLLLALTCRYGEFYRENRPVDMDCIMQELVISLDAKEIENRQLLSLFLLIQFAEIDQSRHEWRKHWENLYMTIMRRDLPYFTATELTMTHAGKGDLVLTLIRQCIRFSLIDMSIVEKTPVKIWDMFIFRPVQDVGDGNNVLPTRPYTWSLASLLLVQEVAGSMELPTMKNMVNNRYDDMSRQDSVVSLRVNLVNKIYLALEQYIINGSIKHNQLNEDVYHEASGNLSISFASVFLSLIGIKFSWLQDRNDYFDGPNLLKRLASSSVMYEQSPTYYCQDDLEALNGFGVYFVLQESGLEQAGQPYTELISHNRIAYNSGVELRTLGDRFPYLLRGFCDPVKSLSTKDRECKGSFQRIPIPWCLVMSSNIYQCGSNKNLKLGNHESLTEGLFIDPEDFVNTQMAIHKNILSIITKLSNQLSLVEDQNHFRKLELILGAVNLCLILGFLYSEIQWSTTATTFTKTTPQYQNLCILSLLKQLLTFIADHFTPNLLGASHFNDVNARLLQSILVKFNTFLLILQDKRTLSRLSHPCADPMDLKFSSELRLPIREIVGSLETYLKSGATTKNSSEIASGAYENVSTNAERKWESYHNKSSTSQDTTTQSSVSMDEFDDSTAYHKPSVNMELQSSVILWCFRLVLLLKKDTGLKLIQDTAGEVAFTPDFLLAVATLLCGIPGYDSLRVCVTIIESAIDTLACGVTIAHTKSKESNELHGSDQSIGAQSLIFHVQALNVLKLRGLMYEKQNTSRSSQSKSASKQVEEKDLLLETAKAFLSVLNREKSQENVKKKSIPMVRLAELESLEVFFRIYPQGFHEFEDLSFYRLQDSSLRVRTAASRSLESLFFSYPDSVVAIFQDLRQHLMESIISNQEMKGRIICSSSTILLAIYIGTCASELNVSIGLYAFIQIMNELKELPISLWLQSINDYYKYPSNSRFLQDHFCYLWTHYIADRYLFHSSFANINCLQIVQNFPITTLLGVNYEDSYAVPIGSTSEGDARPHNTVLFLLQNLDIAIPVLELSEGIHQIMHTNEGDQPNQPISLNFDNVFSFIKALAPYQHNLQEAQDQLSTDLFALSCIIPATVGTDHQFGVSTADMLTDIATLMLSTVEEQAASQGLSYAHLGHIVIKLAKFAVQNIASIIAHIVQHYIKSKEDKNIVAEQKESVTADTLFASGVEQLKFKYSDFSWNNINLAEILVELHTLVLRSRYNSVLATRSTSCFSWYIKEIRSLAILQTNDPTKSPPGTKIPIITSFAMQQFVFSICFQLLKNARQIRAPIARQITLVIRATAELWMVNTDNFGSYLNNLVQSIAEIFAIDAANSDKGSRKLDPILGPDDRVHLEWIIFAICNNMASGLGKYVHTIDQTPDGIASCLDKLNSLLENNFKTNEDQNSSREEDQLANSILGLLSHKFHPRLGQKMYSGSLLPPHGQFITKSWNLGEIMSQTSTVTLFSQIQSSIKTLRLVIPDHESCQLITKQCLSQLAQSLLQYVTLRDSQDSHANLMDDDVLAAFNVLGDVGSLDPKEFEINWGDDGSKQATSPSSLKSDFSVHKRLICHICGLLFSYTPTFDADLDANVLDETLRLLEKLVEMEDIKSLLTKGIQHGLSKFLECFAGASPSCWYAAYNSHRPLKLTDAEHNRLWSSYTTLGVDRWIRSVAAFLAGCSFDPVLSECSAICQLRTDTSRFLLPYLILNVLKNDSKNGQVIKATVEKGIVNILTYNFDASSTYSVDNRPPLEVIQLLMHCVNFLKETGKAEYVGNSGKKCVSDINSSSLPYGYLLPIHPLDLADAAVRVLMPYSAMQFVEMYVEGKNNGYLLSLSDAETSDNEYKDLDIKRIREILVQSFSTDSNIDGLYGINDGRSTKSQLLTYNHEQNYVKTLPLLDVALQYLPTPTTEEGLLYSLRRLGFSSLLKSHLSSVTTNWTHQTDLPLGVTDLQYELAWKSLQWDRIRTKGLSTSLNNEYKYPHNRVIFQSLKLLAHRKIDSLIEITRFAKKQIMQSILLSLRGQESSKQSYAALRQMQCIKDIEDCGKFLTGMKITQPPSQSIALKHSSSSFAALSPEEINDGSYEQTDAPALNELFSSWQKRIFQVRGDFNAIEEILALNEVLYQIVSPTSSTALPQLYLSLARASRKANRAAVAYSALHRLEDLADKKQLDQYDYLSWRMEKAKLLYSQDEERSAVWIAKQVLQEIDTTKHNYSESMELFYVHALTVTGKWIAAQRSESSQVIYSDYLLKATNTVDADFTMKETSTRRVAAAKAHLALAEYMAEMYYQVYRRITSNEWIAGKRVAEAREKELNDCNRMDADKQAENRAHIFALSKEVNYDAEERARVEQSVEEFLNSAIRGFGKCVILSNHPELAVVFRIIGLWCKNPQNSATNDEMNELIDSVPSYKFVPLSYQLISRIAATDGPPTKFQQVLSKLVFKLCTQHPHHALIQLIALKNSDDVEGRGAAEFRANAGDAKASGARLVLDQVRKSHQRELVESMDSLAHAYIQLALFDTSEFHKSARAKINLSRVRIAQLGSRLPTTTFDHFVRDRSKRVSSLRLEQPAVLTVAIAAVADMDYSHVVRLSSFEPQFSITDSGIHRPKIIFCVGSDGSRYKQLVKGKDDTRQDLVIEQVFETVNFFLRNNVDTSQRQLRLCVYKVVPLCPIAGVLEWVDQTLPWGSYLVARTSTKLSAHERYHPMEWKHNECRMKLKNAKDKVAMYREIEKNFTPVFHHFFLEMYSDPATWHTRRLAYIKSVAVNSIVGYILGIGDRHAQNILIREDTSELVHIDFGVVFDQGLALFTPETVPFRLTRDMVDGMGIAGVDGVFSRCCEATLQVLRAKSSSVLTILEVFVHDPLYRWTLSPLKALKIQEEKDVKLKQVEKQNDHIGASQEAHNGDGSKENSSEDARNPNTDAAARALLRVKQKLEGYEDPNGNALSIEGQVKHLIMVARDSQNLSRLFPGWAPWL